MTEIVTGPAPTLAELRARRAEILELTNSHGARNVRVFGSVAREDSERNDVDFLVDMDQDRSLFDMGALLMDLQDLLGCEVDVVTDPGLRKRIRADVLAEAQKL